MRWMKQTVAMKMPESLGLLSSDHHLATEILDAKYEKADLQEVANAQTHLTQEQRDELHKVLCKHERVFDGTLKKYTGAPIHIELKPDATPVHKRPYAVPHAHRAAFKHELDRLEKIGVLERCEASEWAAGSFIIPKKDGTVRWISDFRELNKCIKRRVYPLPKIMDLLTERPGYEFFTKLDVPYWCFQSRPCVDLVQKVTK